MFKYAQGHVYIGEWFDSQQSGTGRLIMKNGQTYVGEFNNNTKHGKGLNIWPEGKHS